MECNVQNSKKPDLKFSNLSSCLPLKQFLCIQTGHIQPSIASEAVFPSLQSQHSGSLSEEGLLPRSSQGSMEPQSGSWSIQVTEALTAPQNCFSWSGCQRSPHSLYHGLWSPSQQKQPEENPGKNLKPTSHWYS